MNSIDIVKGSGVPVRGNDIDTDRIIPARFLKCVTFEGLGANAFADDIAGLAAQGKVHPFRDPAYKNGSILVSNQNFGCGSSREHAPQALKRWGIRAIIAESYSEIFFGNCVAIGVPCYKVSHEVADKILSWIEAHPSEELVTSTESRTLKMGDETIQLTLADGPRGQFLDGSWHARSALMANADKVQELASKLPYMQFLRKITVETIRFMDANKLKVLNELADEIDKGASKIAENNIFTDKDTLKYKFFGIVYNTTDVNEIDAINNELRKRK